MLASMATKTITAPTVRNLPIPERSRLITVASVAIAKNTAAVPPKAVMTSDAPLRSPSTCPTRRDIISPMKKVNASNR